MPRSLHLRRKRRAGESLGEALGEVSSSSPRGNPRCAFLSPISRTQAKKLASPVNGNPLTPPQIAYAKVLLLQIDVPIAEVGRQVGIADQYYFSRRFRRKTGLSLWEFRRRTLGLDEASRIKE